MLPFLLLLAVLQVLVIPQGSSERLMTWQWGRIVITDRGLRAGALLIARFVVTVLGLSLFSFSTTTTELTHGVEHLLRPLQRLHIPAHEFALTVNIAIRFVPILAEEAERLMKAQAARGADFGQGRRNFVVRMRLLLPLLVPLFIVSLQRAEQLIEAMEARCYLGGKGRTHLIELKAESIDRLALLGAFGLAAVVGCMTRAHADQLLWRWLAASL
jgi:energy-coupling factor transport system permease protein